jgi:hypothetical protein
MNGELKEPIATETQTPFDSSVQQSLKHRQEQAEPPPPKTIMEKMDALNQRTREVARKFNKTVKHIPVITPLIEASLDFQKASAAAVYGKDVDTGAKLSGKERANVAVSNFGKFLFNKTIADVESVALGIGGVKAAEKIAKLKSRFPGPKWNDGNRLGSGEPVNWVKTGEGPIIGARRPGPIK